MSYSVVRTRARALANRIEATASATSSLPACSSCRRHAWDCIRSTISIRCSHCVRHNRRCFIGSSAPVLLVREEIRRIRSSLALVERHIAFVDFAERPLVSGEGTDEISSRRSSRPPSSSGSDPVSSREVSLAASNSVREGSVSSPTSVADAGIAAAPVSNEIADNVFSPTDTPSTNIPVSSLLNLPAPLAVTEHPSMVSGLTTASEGLLMLDASAPVPFVNDSGSFGPVEEFVDPSLLTLGDWSFLEPYSGMADFSFLPGAS